MQTILVTGAAGFIGYHTCKELLKQGYKVIGVDNLMTDVNFKLKLNRLEDLGIRLIPSGNSKLSSDSHGNFVFYKSDIKNSDLWSVVKEKHQVDKAIHLAVAEAKLEDTLSPKPFALSQFEGFIQILDFCAVAKVQKLFYAHALATNSDSLSTVLDDFYALNTTIQWMNDHWVSAYWESNNLQALALEFPEVFGSFIRLDTQAKAVIHEKENNNSSNIRTLKPHASKYCDVEKVTSHLLSLIEDVNPTFDRLACPVAFDYWVGLGEIKSIYKIQNTI